ncbi:UDP-glycosyltransferase [Flavobacterium sp. CYK-4]|uniref:UDP-glycosyltransferase n=1 Tax=Flavobacterium lotistagni TaxID=2709660 RepID=UPI00140AF442|nr:UDP-glycosyltransferase [Flavobacterium lotistagni]NHM06408.1 UDP-glycosyltransferase [Flavobacterium lotistagni]
MKSNKVFILLPDGVGLRNYAYTDFYKKGQQQGFEMVFWNNTPFDLSKLGFPEIKISQAKSHPITDVLKKARVQIDLNLNIQRDQDSVYESYRFPYVYKGINNTVKMLMVKVLSKWYSSASGIEKIRSKINKLERKTAYYQHCLNTLQQERPAMVFCTNQRTVSAIGAILAAQDLGIPTATFIFSWDNLPKATLVLEPDFYFVWSQHMKNELLHYYPYIKENQVIITGTPQFETHTDLGKIDSREAFFTQHQLDLNKKYICYSGDDVTTSPNDPQYLQDTADAVRKLNREGHQLGIIFRRCPVDFSDRYDQVLAVNADLITPIAPKWEKVGGLWNAVLPTPEDLGLQMNTIAHTEMVINLGSSMVFDYISFNKPCAYLNYDVDSGLKAVPVRKIYDFVHFRSMPSKDSVFWIDSPQAIAETISKGLTDSQTVLKNAQLWFEKINQHPPQEASTRILKSIQQIVNQRSTHE